MSKWVVSRFLPAVGAALAFNLCLVILAGVIIRGKDTKEKVIEATGVNLVDIAAPEPPKPEEQREAPPPKKEGPLDFTPDLARPDFSAPGALDMGVAINIGKFETSSMTDSFVFEAYELDQPPQPVVRVPPVYPYRARERGIEGVVQVKLLVNSDGSVGDVQIIDARPKGMFEDAVMKCVPQWKFNPGKVEGKPVTAWVVTAVEFSLN
jgi:protein TonB